MQRIYWSQEEFFTLQRQTTTRLIDLRLESSGRSFILSALPTSLRGGRGLIRFIQRLEPRLKIVSVESNNVSPQLTGRAIDLLKRLHLGRKNNVSQLAIGETDLPLDLRALSEGSRYSRVLKKAINQVLSAFGLGSKTIITAKNQVLTVKFQRSIRILYLTRNGLLEPLGQSQIWPYFRGLSKDHSITLISFEKPADRGDALAMQRMRKLCVSHGIHWIPLQFRSKPRPWAPALAIPKLAVVALWQWRRRRGPQLVHARSYVPAAIALLLHRLTGVPFIFDMRALWPEELITASHLRRGSLLHRALLRLEQLCLQEAGAVVSLTQAAVGYLHNQYRRELAGQRIAVIPTCADLQRFQPAGLPPATPLVIGCIGTVLSGWFLITWLRAFFEAIARSDPTARFELISRDAPEEILAALQPAPAWAHRLRIQSATPAEMPAIVQRHTASVMFFTGGLSKLGSSPTRMAEVLGCGRPVVANPGVGDVEQVIRQHRVGVLARGDGPAEMDACVAQLMALLQDPQLASRCRRTAEALFSLESGTATYRQLYSQILA